MTWLPSVLLGMVLMLGFSGCASVPPADATVQPRIAQTTGRVLLVRDSVYFVAEPDMVLQPGDRLLSLAEAHATVQYQLIDAAEAEVGELCQINLVADEELLIQGRQDCN
jgi:UDP-N-acetylglucosamine 2-epimerase